MVENTLCFENNDVYFLETIGNRLIVNDNYEGIMIFDRNFILIRKLHLFIGMMIYQSFAGNNRIVLFCPENQCFVSIDLTLYNYRIIPLGKQKKDWVFSTLYQWRGNRLLLSTYQGQFVQLDVEAGEINEVEYQSDICSSIRQDYEKLRKYNIYKVLPIEKKALIMDTSNVLRVVEYGSQEWREILVDKEHYHDFEVYFEYVASVGEQKVEVSYGKIKRTYYPPATYDYLRGKFMMYEEKVYLFLLACNKSDAKHTRIERYNPFIL